MNRIAIAILAAASLLSPLPASAGQKTWSKPAFSASAKQLWNLAKKHKAKPGSSAVVLHEGMYFRFDEKGRIQRTFRRIFKVYDQRAATSWGTIQAGWAPWFEERPQIRARVLTPDGTFHELDQRTLAETTTGNTPHVYSDYRSLKGPLPAMAPGSIVEQETVLKETQLFFEQGKVYKFFFGAGVPVLGTEVVIEAPKRLRVKIKTRDLPALSKKKTSKGGRNRWVYRHAVIEAIDELEQAIPPDTSQLPHLVFSAGRSWNKLARRYLRVVEDQIAKGGIDSIPFTVTTAGRDRAAVIRDTLAFLHANVRYTGLEFGQSSIVPWTPGETWNRKYGDCKDQAILLVALLRRAGIRAHVALLNAGFGTDVEQSMPSLSQFNHAIVYVPGKKPVWIDPTDEFARAGQLPLSDRGRRALIVAKGTKKLVRTPAARPNDNVFFEEREIFLAEYGGARVIETSRPTGSFESTYRRSYLGSDPVKVRKTLGDYMKSEYLAQEFVSYSMSPVEDVHKPYHLRIEARDARRSSTEEKHARVYLFRTDLLRSMPSKFFSPDAIARSEAKDAKPRVHDFLFFQPHVREQRYQIHIPAGYALRRLPDGEKIKLGTATLSTSFRQDGDMVHATLRLNSGATRLTPKQLSDMRAAIKKVREREAIELTFEHTGMALMAAGNSKEGIAAMQKLVQKLPRSAVHRARLAQAYLDVGLGEPARKNGRLAVDLDPKSVYARWTYGWILSSDLLGRRFSKGYDRTGAIAAYRRLVELDSKESRYRQQLAELLERDDDGVRFGDNADLSGAIEVYRALRKDLSWEETNDELLTVMYQAGRCSDLLATVKSITSPSVRGRALAIACIARDKGVAQALERASTVASGVAERRQLLDTATGLLSSQRHYRAALALSREAAAGASNRAARQAGLDILGKVRRYEEHKRARKRPEALVYQLVTVFLQSPDAIAGKLRKLLSKRALASADLDDRVKSLRRRDVIPNAGNRPGVTSAVYVDFGISLYDITAEAAKPWGHKLTLKPNVSISAPDIHMYTVREGGRHRILGDDDNLGPLGAEALHLAKRKKLAGARVWLDWAREHVPEPPRGNRFRGSPFARLWTKGDKADRKTIRRAAASLLTDGKLAKKAVPILRKCADAGGSDALPCRRALLEAYLTLKQHDRALKLVDNLVASDPDAAESLFWRRGRLLTALKRWTDLAQHARTQLAVEPDDRVAKHLLAESAICAGDLDRGLAVYKELVDGKHPIDNDYNQYAWTALFLGYSGDDILKAAERAVQLSSRKDSSDLNTLAAVHADRGEVLTAYQVMLESTQAASAVDLRRQDWLVYGRIAQGYGLFDLARAAYDKVTPGTGYLINISSYELAKKWRATLPKQ